MRKIFIIGMCILLCACSKTKETEMNTQKGNNESMKEINILVNGKTLNVKLEDNSSSEALYSKLEESDIVVEAEDYGNFEKVGELGFSLPKNDKQINVKAGDLILYQGDKITLYYSENSWNFTLLGKVTNANENELREILGKGDVTMTFSLVK